MSHGVHSTCMHISYKHARATIKDEGLDAVRLCPTIEISVSLEQPSLLIRATTNILDLEGQKN